MITDTIPPRLPPSSPPLALASIDWVVVVFQPRSSHANQLLRRWHGLGAADELVRPTFTPLGRTRYPASDQAVAELFARLGPLRCVVTSLQALPEAVRQIVRAAISSSRWARIIDRSDRILEALRDRPNGPASVSGGARGASARGEP
jgi:hypothetical protein